jgi:hypothetical protein
MRDSFTRDNARDFGARYLHSYGNYLKEDGTKVPVYLKGIEEGTLFFEGLDGAEYSTHRDMGVVFEFTQMQRRLSCGMDGSIMYTSRVPQRQWTRGVSENNTRVYCLTEFGAIQQSLTRDVMRNLLFSGKPTPDRYLLSNQFAIVGTVVYLYNHVIGTYNRVTKEVHLAGKFSCFHSELKDVCKLEGIEVHNA